MSETTIAARIADWVAATHFEDLPRRVVEEAKNQILSVIASVHAGHFSESGRIVTRTVKDVPAISGAIARLGRPSTSDPTRQTGMRKR